MVTQMRRELVILFKEIEEFLPTKNKNDSKFWYHRTWLFSDHSHSWEEKVIHDSFVDDTLSVDEPYYPLLFWNRFLSFLCYEYELIQTEY